MELEQDQEEDCIHFDLGYEMFRDREIFHAHFIEFDILYPTQVLQELHRKMDIIWVCHVLHKWTWEGQVMVAKDLIALSQAGTLLTGFQVGSNVETHYTPTPLMKAESFLHTSDSLVRIWEHLDEETGTECQAEVKYVSLADMGWEDEDLPIECRRIIHFAVESNRFIQGQFC